MLKTEQTSTAFEADVTHVLEELQPALAEIVGQLRPPVSRATHVQRLLGLDRKLAWSIFSAANAQDVRLLASLIPGRRPMDRFFVAASAHGVPDAAIGRARLAFDKFEESVKRHAGNRDAFETMVASIGNNGDRSSVGTEARHKRAMFRTASLLWGRQARLFFGSIIVHPSQAATAHNPLVDRIVIKGMVGLHQTRHGVPLTIVNSLRQRPFKGDPTDPPPFEALEPEDTSPDSVCLLREFSSRPMPRFRLLASEDHFTSHELIANGIGAAAEVTYFTGQIGRAGAIAPGSIPGAELTLTKTIDVPLELYICDVLMHRSIWDESPPSVCIYSSPLPGTSMEFRDSDIMPLTESAQYLGMGLPAGRTPHLPRYEEMMSCAMRFPAWNPAEFRVFRCLVDHPVISSRIRMTFLREGE